MTCQMIDYARAALALEREWPSSIEPHHLDTCRAYVRGYDAGVRDSREQPPAEALVWRCSSCHRQWRMPTPPGFPGDGVYHYEQPGNRQCGPIYAQRQNVGAGDRWLS